MILPIKYRIDMKISFEIQNQFQELILLPDINVLYKLILEWCYIFLWNSEYTTWWANNECFSKIEKHDTWVVTLWNKDSIPGVDLLPDINLLIQLVLQ
jgi:hypothetical protein